MTKTWFTSDLHVGDPFVADLRGFSSTAAHDGRLSHSWDLQVGLEDKVWVLGDISSGKDEEEQLNALRWIADRPGRKYLITGNHDGAHPRHHDSYRWQKRYLQVFECVQPFARRRVGHHRVLLSHFPYAGDGEGLRDMPERYTQFRLPNFGDWLLHGHTHCSEKVRSRSIHVGPDAWDLSLAGLPDVVALIDAASTKARRAS